MFSVCRIRYGCEQRAQLDHAGKRCIESETRSRLPRLVGNAVELEPAERTVVLQVPDGRFFIKLEGVEQRKQLVQQTDRIVLLLKRRLTDRRREKSAGQ